jgi:hypothetical protein
MLIQVRHGSKPILIDGLDQRCLHTSYPSLELISSDRHLHQPTIRPIIRPRKTAKPSHSTLALLLDPLVVILIGVLQHKRYIGALLQLVACGAVPQQWHGRLGLNLFGTSVDGSMHILRLWIFKCLIICASDSGTLRTIPFHSTLLNALLRGHLAISGSPFLRPSSSDRRSQPPCQLCNFCHRRIDTLA